MYRRQKSGEGRSNGSHLGRLGADLEAELLLSCHLGSLDVEGFSVILLV